MLTVTWQKSPSTNVQQYSVAWKKNGVVVQTDTVPQSSAADTASYSDSFTSGTVSPAPGDTWEAEVSAQDTVNHLTSSPVPSNDVTVPAPPPIAPAPPTNVVLTLS